MSRISVKTLKDFLKKATLNNRLPDFVLNSTEQELDVEAIYNEVTYVKGLLKVAAFKTYAPFGKHGIHASSTFQKLLGRYTGDMELTVENNKLLMTTENGSTHVPTTEHKYIDSFPKHDIAPVKALFDDVKPFTISAENFCKIKTGLSAVDAARMTLKVEGGLLFFDVETEEGYKVQEKVKVDCEDCHAIFGEPLTELMEVLEGNLQVYMGNEKPIKIVEEKATYTMTYIVAPFDEVKVKENQEANKEVKEDEQPTTTDGTEGTDKTAE